MRTRQSKSTGTLQKVCECLYRYSSNGVYYARFESGGKEIRRSLRTTDRRSAQPALGWLKQERQEVDGQVSRSIMTHLPARGDCCTRAKRAGTHHHEERRPAFPHLDEVEIELIGRYREAIPAHVEGEATAIQAATRDEKKVE